MPNYPPKLLRVSEADGGAVLLLEDDGQLAVGVRPARLNEACLEYGLAPLEDLITARTLGVFVDTSHMTTEQWDRIRECIRSSEVAAEIFRKFSPLWASFREPYNLIVGLPHRVYGGLSKWSLYTSLFVSDGNMQVTREGDRLGEPKKANPKLNEGLTGAIARGGFMLPRLVLRDDAGSFNADKILLISDFKLGAKERIGTVDAQAVEYSVTFGGLATGPTEMVAVTIWIDPKTELPLKRKVIVGNREADYFTEVYMEFAVDPKLDAKVFELPK